MGRGIEYTFFERRLPNGEQVHKKIISITKYQRNANHNHNKIPLHLVEWLLSIRKAISNVLKDVEKRDPLCTVDGTFFILFSYGHVKLKQAV